MKTKKEITCIGCPMGCMVSVTLDDGKIETIEGYSCNRGKVYAEKECTNPTRIVTTTLPVDGGEFATVPVKTASDIPKDKIFDCIKALREVRIQAPVKTGEAVVKNIVGTGVDIIATGTVMKKENAS